MEQTLAFTDLLRLIDERAATFRATIAAAPSLDVPVPTCPEWTLADLTRHLGHGRRRWAVTVTAGPADAPPDPSTWQHPPAPTSRDALLAWQAAATQELLDALRRTGPDQPCWTWWGDSQTPQTTGAVARHQLHEVAVHTYDAQLAAGHPQPLPHTVALDGVEDFLLTCCATRTAWPHEPVAVDYHTTEGPSWRLRLDTDGARTQRLPSGEPADTDPAAAAAIGTASDIVLVLYGRNPVDALELHGDRRHFDRLVAWDPTA